MIEESNEIVSLILQKIANLLNSGFGAALAGAFFGALAASYFADRFERRQLLTRQLVAGNAATSLAIAIFQHSLGFKDQLRPFIVESYFEDRNRLIRFLEKEPRPSIFEVEYNFGTVGMFRAEVDKLLDLVILQASADQKVVMASTFLMQTVHALDRSLSTRNEVLMSLASIQKSVSEIDFARSFFGIEDASGNVDMRLFEATKAIDTQLDDTIFYSKLIAENQSTRNAEIAKAIGRSSPSPIIFKFDKSAIERLQRWFGFSEQVPGVS